MGKVSAGIRQGCPLSPYLFIVVLTVIFHDVDDLLLKRGVPTNTWSEGYPVYDLEYADDTLLLARTIPQMQSFLSALEEVASEYGMALNKVKTELLTKQSTPNPQLRFSDDSIVPTTEVVKYLGSLITWSTPFDTAFKHRASLAAEAFKKLTLIWNSSLPIPSKIRVFQSTFVPVLIYGLDSFTLTTPLMHRIDAYCLRFLRRVLGIKASYYSRIPNSEVYNKARRPKLPAQTLSDAQYKMMKEVFLSDMSDIPHSVVFNAAYKDRISNQGKRRGRPVPYWVEVMASQYFPEVYHSKDHTALGPSKYASSVRQMQHTAFGQAPKSADTRAWP